MNFVKRHFEIIYWWLTLATLLGSAASFMFLMLVSMMVGFDSAPFDWLIGLSFLTTMTLLGGAFSVPKNRSVTLLVLISSAYLPVAFVVLTALQYVPPLGWWSVFCLNVGEVLISSLRLAYLRSSEDHHGNNDGAK